MPTNAELAKIVEDLTAKIDVLEGQLRGGAPAGAGLDPDLHVVKHSGPAPEEEEE